MYNHTSISFSPRQSLSSSVRSRTSITVLGSASGWNGFCRKEFDSGSSRIRVNFMFPAIISSRVFINFLILTAKSSSESLKALRSFMCPLIFSRSPSTVVQAPPRVPQSSSSSRSGILTQQDSLLKRSLLRSATEVTLRVMCVLLSVTAPLVLVSVECAPQKSQVKLMIIRSLKCGMLVWHSFMNPGMLQEWQDIQNIEGSWCIKSLSVTGSLKSIFFTPSSTYSVGGTIPSLAFYSLYPMARICSLVLLKLVMNSRSSSLGANGFLMFECPLGSYTLKQKGRNFPLAQSFILSMSD